MKKVSQGSPSATLTPLYSSGGNIAFTGGVSSVTVSLSEDIIFDIDVLHARLDNPGMSREDAEDLIKMHREMEV